MVPIEEVDDLAYIRPPVPAGEPFIVLAEYEGWLRVGTLVAERVARSLEWKSLNMGSIRLGARRRVTDLREVWI